MFKLKKLWIASLGMFSVLANSAMSAEAGRPVNWQLGFQEAATPVMEKIIEVHDIILYIILSIFALVFLITMYIIFRFNSKRNPEPSKFTDNVPLEIFWTAVPTVIIGFFIYKMADIIYFMDKTDEPEMTVKVIGHQWYWEYQYPDLKGIVFDSRIIPDNEIKKEKGQIRLLSVDNPIVVPVDTNVRIYATSNDVIHSWAVPSFGIKKDTVPGRINETWMRVTKTGTFYGQCSELCGMEHGFMPIEVRVVSKDDYKKWVENMKKNMPLIEEGKFTTADALKDIVSQG